MGGQPGSAGGDPVGTPYGSEVEGSAGPVSEPVHLLEAVEEVGGGWDLVEDMEGLSCNPGREGPAGLLRGLRCDFLLQGLRDHYQLASRAR